MTRRKAYQPKRSYGQYCGLALALDVIGERWSLLMVRELMTGPKRYSELEVRLQGIGTNLLADRLKSLAAAGVLRKLDSGEYELTETGRELEKTIVPLARWGLGVAPTPSADDYHVPSSSVLIMHAVFRPDRAEGVDEYYEYRIGDDIFHAHVCDGELQTWEGPAPDPAFTLTTDASTYRDMLAGTVLLREAVAQGKASVTGSTDALIRSGRVFDMTGLRRNRPA